MKKSGLGVLSAWTAVLVLGCLASLPAAPFALGQGASSAQSDNNLQAQIRNTLKGSNYKNVQIAVKDGIVDLTGTVKDYSTKEEAQKKVERVKNTIAIRNELHVEGAGEMSDQALQQSIVKKLQYDRVGYGNAFNAIGVSVRNGVVTLSGNALGPVAADSAYSLVSRTRGVRDVINQIQVDPVSPMDWNLRLRLYRAIYGYPPLQKYSINPAQPIRITVVNGNVTLDGIVDNKGDKDMAGLRANGVSGVFSVKNNLQVGSTPSGNPTEQ